MRAAHAAPTKSPCAVQKAGKQSSAATASAQDAAAKKKDYDAMKVELQGLTASLVALGICACAVFYSKVSPFW